MLPYFDDLNYFYIDSQNNLIEVPKLNDVPEDIQGYSRIMDAVAYFQQLGMLGLSANIKGEGRLFEDYNLNIQVLKIGFERYKQLFPVLYRGCRKTSRPDKEYKILFTTPQIEVAKFYGDTIREYRNVYALLTHGKGVSVVSGDYTFLDEEAIIIF
jgi:hypothetical protein